MCHAQRAGRRFVYGVFLWAVIFLPALGTLLPKPVAAAGGDGATSNILLLDSVIDGYADRIEFDVANPNGETWSLQGAAPHGLSVTQGGSAITIQSVALVTAATANPVRIRVTLDTSDTDLDLTTDGVTTNPIELVYTQQTGDQTCTVCIRDAVDEELNTIATGDSGATNTELDRMAPIVSFFDYTDQGGDGHVSEYTVFFSEQVVGATSDLEFTDFTVVNDGDFDGVDFRNEAGDLITSDTIGFFTNFDLSTPSSVVDSHDDSGDFEIGTTGTFTLEDAAGNANTEVEFDGGLPGVTIRDDARPVIVSVSPASAATSVNRSSAIAVTFSEAMDTTFDEGTEFSISPDPSAWVSGFTDGDTVVTLTHVSSFLPNTTYVVTLDETEINAAVGQSTGLLTTGPEDETWSFRSASASSSSTSSEILSPGIELQSPEENSTLTGGTDVSLGYFVSGNGIASVELSYVAGTDESVEIATGLSPTAEDLTWSVPGSLSGAITLRADGISAAGDVIASDTVAVSVVAAPVAEEQDGETGLATDETSEPNEEEGLGYTVNAHGQKVADGSGTYGPSPVDGESEEISVLRDGWFVRSPSFTTVYYVNAGGRHAFWDTQTFFTWADSWDDVVWVTDATLSTLPLTSVMLPQSEAVLVKVQDSADVYAVGSDDTGGQTLRRISNEATATAVYGSDWADYVIDLSPTVFLHFGVGEAVDANEEADLGQMKKRMEIQG